MANFANSMIMNYSMIIGKSMILVLSVFSLCKVSRSLEIGPTIEGLQVDVLYERKGFVVV